MKKWQCDNTRRREFIFLKGDRWGRIWCETILIKKVAPCHLHWGLTKLSLVPLLSTPLDPPKSHLAHGWPPEALMTTVSSGLLYLRRATRLCMTNSVYIYACACVCICVGTRRILATAWKQSHWWQMGGWECGWSDESNPGEQLNKYRWKKNHLISAEGSRNYIYLAQSLIVLLKKEQIRIFVEIFHVQLHVLQLSRLWERMVMKVKLK